MTSSLLLDLCENWFLPNEVNYAVTIANMGASFGATLFAFSGTVYNHLGWQALFYLPGSIGFVVGLMILVFYTDDPRQNRHLSKEELNLIMDGPDIRKSLKTCGYQASHQCVRLSGNIMRIRPKRPTPWLKMATSLPVYAVVLASTGYSWTREAGIIYTQNYLMDIHDYGLGKTSIINTLCGNLSMFVIGICGGYLFEFFIIKNWTTKTCSRRLGALVATMVAVFHFLMASLDCHSIDKGVVPLVLLNGLRAGYFMGPVANMYDITPSHRNNLNLFWYYQHSYKKETAFWILL